MEVEEIPIIYTEWGLANNFGDRIEINSGLKNDWRLREYIIEHERGHKKSFDLWHEFKWNNNIPRLIKFVLFNPKTWIDLSPIQYRKKILIYDINLIIMYCMVAIGLYFLIKLI